MDKKYKKCTVGITIPALGSNITAGRDDVRFSLAGEESLEVWRSIIEGCIRFYE
jgi:hypothetical protein